jgi:hypothetical protein
MKKSKSFPSLGSLLLLFGVAVNFLTEPAFAKVYVYPSNAGSESTENSGGSFSYFVGTVTAPAFIKFTPIDLTLESSSDPSLENYVEINVRSANTLSLQTGQQAVIVLLLNSTAGATSTSVYAPIATVNGEACNDRICQGRVFSDVYRGNRYYAAKYPGSLASVRVGFYPTEVCKDFHSRANANGQGCNTSTFGIDEPEANSATTMSFQVNIIAANDSNATTALPTTGTALDKLDSVLNFVFSVDSPSMSCPDQNTLNNSYKPQPGQIILDTTLFGVNTKDAPLRKVCVVGQDQSEKGASADPVVDKTFEDSGVNSLAKCVDFKGSNAEPIPGFTNSTNADPHLYNVSFIMQNTAGVYAPPRDGNADNCYLSPVGASDVEQAVPADGCFIATAAFVSAESEPVQLLREFRDQFLLRNGAGKTFVKWYYSWSPRAADWLGDHPVFRLPVLLLLAPLEAFAWVAVHAAGQLAYGLSILMFILITFSARGVSARRVKRVSDEK